MNKENLIPIIMIIMFCSVLLFGCADENDIPNNYFAPINEYSYDGGTCNIVYAKDTKVKYLIWHNGHNGRQGSITPLYNSDGSVQIYEEGKEKDK